MDPRLPSGNGEDWFAIIYAFLYGVTFIAGVIAMIANSS